MADHQVEDGRRQEFDRVEKFGEMLDFAKDQKFVHARAGRRPSSRPEEGLPGS
jgi:hypothetical protein